MCNEQLWSVFLPFLSKAIEENYEFVHVRIPKNHNFSEISAFLNGYFEEDKVNIIGFSLGGYISANFTASFPERVNKAFIIANSPCALSQQEIKQRQEIVKFVNQHGYKGMSKVRAAQLFDCSKWSKSQLEQLINIMITMDAELGEPEFSSQMRFTSSRVDLFRPLVSSQIPLTFYYSDHDPLVNSAWLAKLAQQNSKCEVICSSGASHMLPLEKPQELAKHILKWLNAY